MNDEELLKIDVSSRLPYGLKAYNKNGNTILNISMDAHFSMKDLGTQEWYCPPIVLVNNRDIKPILFPVSGMKENLSFRGDKFVPLERLAVLEGHLFLNEASVSDSSDWMLKIKDDSYSLCYYAEEAQFYLYDEEEECDIPTENALTLYDSLNKWMIDYRGLIDKGLAISVYDLKQNPYE